LLAAAALEAGLDPTPLPDGLRVRRRGDLLFAMNYDTEPQWLEVPQAEWLLGGPRVAPHDVSVARRAAR
jgi:beta-galactosidase